MKFPTSDKARHLAKALLDRNLYKRAFAVAGRFIAGLDIGSPIPDREVGNDADILPTEDEQDAERSRVMRRVNNDLAEFPDRLGAEHDIGEFARELGGYFGENHLLRKQSLSLQDHHIIVDLPHSPYPARITTMVCMENGRLDVPDLFYDPARWAEVYNIQRRTAYVFSDSQQLELVALAARIWFLRKYSCVLDDSADRFSKTDQLMEHSWFTQLEASGALTPRECGYLTRPRLVHVPFRLEWRHVPQRWRETSPNFIDTFNHLFNQILGEGIPALAEQELRAALRCVFQFVQSRSEDRSFVTQQIDSEQVLQLNLARSLRDQGLSDVTEGSKRAGGETDLVVGRRVLIENKLLKPPTDDPFGAASNAGLQGRRYVLPTGQRFEITVVGYRSRTENGKFPPHGCVQVRQLDGIDTPFVEIRIAVRYGDTVPSAAS